MIIYIYDGSFEGLLTVIYEVYYNKNKPENIFKKREYIHNFLHKLIEVSTSEDKWKKVYEAIRVKISEQVLRNIYLLHLSELENIERLIIEYIKLAFKVGRDIDLHMYDARVFQVHKVVKKIEYEKHRMMGFVRFDPIGENVFYSKIEPDYNILELIMPHFSQRFKEENFIIHDVRRKLGGIYSKENGKWRIHTLHLEDIPQINNNELYNKLWKEYFSSVSIKERKNPRLQRRMMPKRYWKHMSEFNS